MNKIFALILSTPLVSAACPNLDGIFTYPGASTIEINHKIDVKNITTYSLKIDDGTCALCYAKEVVTADGLVKQRHYGRADETLQVSCTNDRLKYRRTTVYHNESGEVEFTEILNQDYRINDQNNLAIETVENDVPVSKVVCERLD